MADHNIDPNDSDCSDLSAGVDRAGHAFEASSLASATTNFTGNTCDAESPELPRQIGRYRIERLLGRGGFGLVYLARDDQLARPVAIKVPHAQLIADPKAAEAYLLEARTVANLDHPNIVPVYDVGSTAEFPCYVVAKYIDGTDLAARLKVSRLTMHEAVELVATAAEALHHAHKQGLVHRDIKPGNILLDHGGKPFVADFGLALREEDAGKGPLYVGTPAYMSPEQARGEGHRVDGRSDIFSLGVVLYELLTGRRPFKADSRDELLEQIAVLEVRPPRQVDDQIPRELDRICLKALSKRASERYSAARDLAEDLRHIHAAATPELLSTLSGSPKGQARPASDATTPAVDLHTTPHHTPSDLAPLRIVPKGLRSFDAADADFFLELLPGPRDRDGLPESIRFWKCRIETRDEDTFSVGLVYGPSGCGKSSLVKAGLLPRLAATVKVVYIESARGQTEVRLLKSLRRQLPDLPGSFGLVESLAAIRRGRFLEPGQKVLLVLDQFEQWLHARGNEENAELVDALWQCDGGRLQCIVMVRDDFWMAATRFMRDLDISLLEGQNSAAVDLFPIRHAEKVMAAFGRAFGELPANAAGDSKEQQQFVAQAVAGLAQDGKVISVRLALFAEMLKGRPWTPATLRQVGGVEGVGATFLEETFSASTAPPQHRYHQKAAQAILKALVPEAGTDIKGHGRSRQELLAVSGYANRPADFDDLLRILDSEIRLITPSDPEGDHISPLPLGEGKGVRALHYQLTHDYLVHSLRDWLTRKQKETRRGRAELLLADRAAVWNARPEARQLPSLAQYLRIQALTNRAKRTPVQRKMMSAAARHHLLQAASLAAILALLGWGGYELNGYMTAKSLRDRVLEAKTHDVLRIIGEARPYRRWLDPLLRDALRRTEVAGDKPRRLHASMALLPVDPGQVEYVLSRLLESEPQDLSVIREALEPHGAALREGLWPITLSPLKSHAPERLRAAAALAAYDPSSENWPKCAPAVVDDLVHENPVDLAYWTSTFEPVSKSLLAPLAAIYRDRAQERSAERALATNILADYAAGDPEMLADLLMDADEKQFPAIYAKLREVSDEGMPRMAAEIARTLPKDATNEAKEALAKRQANAAVALFRSGRIDGIWPLLRHSSDPRGRSHLIHALGPKGADPSAIVARFRIEPELSIRRALLLSLGEFSEEQFPVVERKPLIADLMKLYKREPDAGLHAAAEWLLRIWGHDGEMKAIDDLLCLKTDIELQNSQRRDVLPESRQRMADLDAAVSRAEIAVAACEKELSDRQAAWEREMKARRGALPASLSQGLVGQHWVNGLGNVFGRAIQLNKATVWVGKALRFEANRPFSYGCWFQYDGPIPMILLSSRDLKKGSRGFDVSLEENHQLRATVVGEPPDLAAEKRVPYSPYEICVIGEKSVNPAAFPGWHHVMVTYDGSEKAAGVKIYVDGRSTATRTIHDAFRGTMQSGLFRMGNRDGTYRFEGAMCDARIYDRVLSAEEARQLYDVGICSLIDLAPEERSAAQKATLAATIATGDEASRRTASDLAAVRKTISDGESRFPRHWWVNSQGQTMVVFRGPVEFTMGSPPGESGRHNEESLNRIRIGRTFALASKPVTLGQYSKAELGEADYARQVQNAENSNYVRSPDQPVVRVDWYRAARYCNALSKAEGIDEKEWVYDVVGSENINMRANYLSLRGYRLPTEAEWEYAARAGAETARYFGETEELLGKYSWYSANSRQQPWPVGLLKPNDFGLFDMHGNVFNWCQEGFRLHQASLQSVRDDEEDELVVSRTGYRLMRGGSFIYPTWYVRSASRLRVLPLTAPASFSFRVARTYNNLVDVDQNRVDVDQNRVDVGLTAPRAWLKFDESAGTIAADAAGNGWTGTLQSGATWSSGLSGNAVSLDGINGHVRLPRGVVNGLTDFTISAWVKLADNPKWSRIFDFGGETYVYMFLTANPDVPNSLRFSITTDGTEERISGRGLAVGTWNHVAVTLTGRVGTLYLNGRAIGTNKNMTLDPSSLGATPNNYLGKSQTAEKHHDPAFHGQVDDFRIYASGLSSSQIESLYRSRGRGPTAGSEKAPVKAGNK